MAAAEGHLDLVRELVEQHRADLLHKSNVSSAFFCLCFSCFRLLPSLWFTSFLISTHNIKETLYSQIGRDINILTYLVVNSLCSVAQ